MRAVVIKFSFESKRRGQVAPCGNVDKLHIYFQFYLDSLYSMEGLLYQSGNIEDGIGNGDACALQCCYFSLCRAGIAGDDGSGMAHALSRRGCATGDKSDDRLLH